MFCFPELFLGACSSCLNVDDWSWVTSTQKMKVLPLQSNEWLLRNISTEQKIRALSPDHFRFWSLSKICHAKSLSVVNFCLYLIQFSLGNGLRTDFRAAVLVFWWMISKSFYLHFPFSGSTVWINAIKVFRCWNAVTVGSGLLPWVLWNWKQLLIRGHQVRGEKAQIRPFCQRYQLVTDVSNMTVKLHACFVGWSSEMWYSTAIFCVQQSKGHCQIRLVAFFIKGHKREIILFIRKPSITSLGCISKSTSASLDNFFTEINRFVTLWCILVIQK